MISGVVTEIYKKIYETAEKKRHASKAEIENASHKYDKNYRERHGQLKVFCVGMREPISLDNVYVAVQFLNQHTASRYSSPEDVEQAFRERNRRPFDSTSDERQDGTQVANSKQYLMLLGGPGVGKSTFLRKVGLEALKGKNGNFEHKCIPVFLELKRFTEAQIDIETLIAREFEICSYPHPELMTDAALKSGKLLILFDGLDEVPTSNVDNVIRKIADFVDLYSQNRFIASCRIAAYKGGFTRFTEVEMADFDDPQIQTYIKNWFDSTPDPNLHQLDESMQTADRCWTMLNASEHSATKELAQNPLLLTLLCMVYDNSQNFQRNRASLYEDALNIFLREWLAEKRVRRDDSVSQYLDIADEKRMLSEIAAKNFETNRLFFNKDELITQIRKFGEGNANTPQTFNAPKILDTILIDQGLFVERVRDSYSFSHLTFQEYLTANYIVRDTRSIKGLTKKHLHNKQWREVFLLTSGLMHEADDLLKAMEVKAAKVIDTPGLKALFRWAKRITDTTDNQYSGLTKRAFVLDQYFSLWWSNTIEEEVKNHVKYDLYFYRYLNLDLHQNVYLIPNFGLHLGLYLNLYQDLHQNFHQDLYQDLYRYVDLYFYRLLSAANKDQFDEELRERITLVKRMEQMKIFKGVDLQRMVRRFNEQRKFIRTAGRGESIEPPVESIHDTWLSVLGITSDMLAISHEEMRNYFQYFRVVELIVACKEAAGRVSPDVWQRIEDRFLTVDAEGFEG